MRHERYFKPSRDEPLAAPRGLWRGIKFAVPISAVLWVLIGLAIWWLL